jgi:alpha-mannosidase
VKLAEDGSGDLVVRLYEAFGNVVAAQLQLGVDHAGVIETDLLERSVPSIALRGDGSLRLRPFQILTLRFAMRQAGLERPLD